MVPTFTTVLAADGSQLKIATRIDADGMLRVDVYRSDDKTNPVCSGVVKPAELEIARKDASGRWFIVMGQPGFNSPANNRGGYKTEAAAVFASRRYATGGR